MVLRGSESVEVSSRAALADVARHSDGERRLLMVLQGSESVEVSHRAALADVARHCDGERRLMRSEGYRAYHTWQISFGVFHFVVSYFNSDSYFIL